MQDGAVKAQLRSRDGAEGPSALPRRHAAVTSRRRLVLVLNGLTVIVLFVLMAAVVRPDRLGAAGFALLAAYALTLPWLSIGLWNALIGYALDRRHGEAAAEWVNPALAKMTGHEPVTARVAIVMPLRNEDPDASIARLRALQAELSASGLGEHFAYHLLSDTDRPAVAAREETLAAIWRHAEPQARIVYRRRTDNSGYKAGNIAEFVHRAGDEYDVFLPLDADSTMGAATVLRMVRVMQAHPELGMLQSLVTGLPAQSFFTRAFQFGMRHGMRSYTLGSAWWQADCGPNWGHNVLIRLAPFRDHCMLPELSGRGPLSGHILSHDQVEAALMRRAGYEVRVIAEESDSHEINPPSLLDFVRRELRWMNGNMQYLKLLGMPGLPLLSRVQLALAIQMYVAAPAWMAFILIGIATAGQAGGLGDVAVGPGVALFALLMLLNLMPKLMGLAQVLAERGRSAAYGGPTRVVFGGLLEIVFSMLTAPIVSFSLSLFGIGLLFGRRIGWDAQQRDRARLAWGEAAAMFWPQTLAGIAMTGYLAMVAPGALAFASPMLAALAGAIPIAVLSAHPAAGRLALRHALFAIPEDRIAHAGALPAAPDEEEGQEARSA